MNATQPEYWFKQSGIPERYHHVDFEDYDADLGNPPVLKAAKYLDRTLERGNHGGVGLTLLGPPGRGKTLVASILARRHILRNPPHTFLGLSSYEPPARFVTLARYQRALLKAIAENAPRPESLAEVELLVIDDVGREKVSAHIETELELLLRERYDLGNPTIITTNRTPKSLATIYSETLYSFLREATVLVDTPGPDVRERIRRAAW